MSLVQQEPVQMLRGHGKSRKRNVKYRRHITTSLPTISEEPRLSFEVVPASDMSKIPLRYCIRADLQFEIC